MVEIDALPAEIVQRSVILDDVIGPAPQFFLRKLMAHPGPHVVFGRVVSLNDASDAVFIRRNHDGDGIQVRIPSGFENQGRLVDEHLHPFLLCSLGGRGKRFVDARVDQGVDLLDALRRLKYDVRQVFSIQGPVIRIAFIPEGVSNICA